MYSCKKETDPTPTIGSDFFIEGKGMRVVWGMVSETIGLGAFGLTQLTASPDGFMHTVFTYGLAGVNGSPATYKAYRKKINITTGDTLATNGINSFINTTYIGQQQSGCLEYGLVPYTDKFVYSSGSFIKGDPNWQDIYFASGFAKIYDTKQAVCESFSSVIAPYLSAQYFSNGVNYPSTGSYINTQALSASVELPISGNPLAFIATKTDSLIVMDFTTNTMLAGIAMPLFQQYIPTNYPYNHRPDSRIITRRSVDGTKIIGMVWHTANYFPQGSGRMFSTFVYDIASQTVIPKIQNSFLNTGFYLTNTEDFDDDGNFFYLTSSVAINKITPIGGDNAYKSEFLKNSGKVITIRVVSNKLIVACAVDGIDGYSDDRGKGMLVIAVEN